MSALASLLSRKWWWRHRTFVLRVISLRRKRRPAGTALAAKASLPMSESSCRFVVFLHCSQSVNSSRISFNFVLGSRICWRTESSSRPRKVRMVAGPSTLSSATGNPVACKREESSAGDFHTKWSWEARRESSHPGSV